MTTLNRAGVAFILGLTVAVLVVFFRQYGTPARQEAARNDATSVGDIAWLAGKIQKRAKANPKGDWEKGILEAEWKHSNTNRRYGYRKLSPREFELTAEFSSDQALVERMFGRIDDKRLAFRPGLCRFKFGIWDAPPKVDWTYQRSALDPAN